MTRRIIKDIVAGDQFRKSIIPRADHMDGPRPMFYGWAVMDAFLAGIDYARAPAYKKGVYAALGCDQNTFLREKLMKKVGPR